MIKHVVCDMGNVLLRYDPFEILNRTLADPADREAVFRALFAGEEWVKSDLGEIDKNERYRRVAAAVPARLHAALAVCNEQWSVCMRPLPGALSFLREVRAKGLGLYLLSNAGFEFDEYFPRAIDPALFDGIRISAKLGMLKPDPAIYRRLLSDFSLPAGECLFIDDMEANVKGALAVGMHAVRFTGDFGAAWEAIRAEACL